MSEYTKRIPQSQVIAWLDAQAQPDLFVSALTLAELDKGVLKLAAREAVGDAPAGRAARLSVWLATVRQRFATRILPVDDAVWQHWARQSASAEMAGSPISPMDALIMATAHSRGLGIVTRNVADFQAYPHVFNPWSLPP